MKLKTQRVGAIASAFMLFTMLFAGDGSGAHAESELAASAPAWVATEGSAVVESETRPGIRFVASPVVQEVVEDEVLEGADFASDAASLHELVAVTPSGGELSRELLCLAQAVYFESRGEPLAGQLAVARVIINRSASPLFPDDYCSVVTQKSQFSFVRSGRIPEPNKASGAWARATAIARIAHQELWQSEAHDALYFHADYVRPRWANRKTARATIDSHIFYR